MGVEIPLILRVMSYSLPLKKLAWHICMANMSWEILSLAVLLASLFLNGISQACNFSGMLAFSDIILQ